MVWVMATGEINAIVNYQAWFYDHGLVMWYISLIPNSISAYRKKCYTICHKQTFDSVDKF